MRKPKNHPSLVPKSRILIVDDHPIIRHGVAQTISVAPDLEVSCEASSAAEALASLHEHAVDMAVIDVSLNGTNGIELIKQLRSLHPLLPILVLSMHDEVLYAMRAIRAGAGGYIMKREAPEMLLTAVRKVLAGELYVSASMGQRISENGARFRSSSSLDSLTDREIEVLQLVGEGHGTREIAQQLGLSTKTVETHRLHMREKLEVRSGPELIRFAVDWVRKQNG